MMIFPSYIVSKFPLNLLNIMQTFSLIFGKNSNMKLNNPTDIIMHWAYCFADTYVCSYYRYLKFPIVLVIPTSLFHKTYLSVCLSSFMKTLNIILRLTVFVYFY